MSVRPRILLLALVALSCSPECRIERTHDVVSPTGALIATVFVENCHATAPFVTAVNVRCAACRFDPDDSVAAFEGVPEVTLKWDGERTLLVRHDRAKAYRRSDRWKNVTVRYEPSRSIAP